jgi:RNA polymerase sigma-70 factor (TIGR02960 family)
VSAVRDDAFRELAEAHRRELQTHCYRLLGSVQDAEDLVQETLLAAWRGLDGFEGRASLRAWLYRIATNRCLNALRDRGRRVPELPGPPDDAPVPPEPTRRREPVWLEPYPDALLEARYEQREAIGLAFVAALQRLPPRQRAVLVLRYWEDVSIEETAALLDCSPGTVKSQAAKGLQALRELLVEEKTP